MSIKSLVIEQKGWLHFVIDLMYCFYLCGKINNLSLNTFVLNSKNSDAKVDFQRDAGSSADLQHLRGCLDVAM